MNDNAHPYSHPDIRKQTIQEAEKFISAKRVARMVMLTTYKQKVEAKLSTMKDKELGSFTVRKEKVDKALNKVVDAIEAAERAIAALNNTHNAISNIEQEETKL